MTKGEDTAVASLAMPTGMGKSDILVVVSTDAAIDFNTATPLAMDFDTAAEVVHGTIYHSETTNSTRVVARADGTYCFLYSISCLGDSTDQLVRFRMRKNGSTYIGPSSYLPCAGASGSDEGSVSLSHAMVLVVDDYIELMGDRSGNTGTVLGQSTGLVVTKIKG